MTTNDGLSLFLSPYKICYHADRLGEWLETGICAPITVSLDLTLQCGHNCPACPYHSFRRACCEEPFSQWEKLQLVLEKLALGGIRGVLFTGGGEPLASPHASHAIRHARSLGMQVALITNGEFLDEEIAAAVIASCEWIRVSVDAATEDLYVKMHGVSGDIFSHVCANVERLVRMKRLSGSSTVIGLGMLTNHVTMAQMASFGSLSSNLQVDYCQFRPLQVPGEEDVLAHQERFEVQLSLTRNILQGTKTELVASPTKYAWVLGNNDGFPFSKCFAPHFASVVGADGTMYLCPHFRYNSHYAVANMLSGDWIAQRSNAILRLAADLPGPLCPNLCKHSALNAFLEDMLNARVHEAFL